MYADYHGDHSGTETISVRHIRSIETVPMIWDNFPIFRTNRPFSKMAAENLNEAIPIKCFVSHRPPSREGGSVGQKINK